MTQLGLEPYTNSNDPAPNTVPVTVVVLTKDEERNIERCISSVAWADQIVVVDSGSTDKTTRIAQGLGADIVVQSWLGFSAQRDFALKHPIVRNNWVYFVDADEWVSTELAAEIAIRLQEPSCAAYIHRLRLVFQGRWIRHCGWYKGSWVVRLVDRRYTSYDGSPVGERAQVAGPIHRLSNDIVDQDRKGLALWLHKHIRYAELEARHRERPAPLPQRIRAIRSNDSQGTRPLVRTVLKEIVFPQVPLKPVALFIFMYFVRLGFLDGSIGLRFCFYHAWYEASVAALQADISVVE